MSPEKLVNREIPFFSASISSSDDLMLDPAPKQNLIGFSMDTFGVLILIIVSLDIFVRISVGSVARLELGAAVDSVIALTPFEVEAFLGTPVVGSATVFVGNTVGTSFCSFFSCLLVTEASVDFSFCASFSCLLVESSVDIPVLVGESVEALLGAPVGFFVGFISVG